MNTPSWDPALYLSFDDHRSRPFHDLLARVGATAPRRVVDLGCGPGHLTGLLAARWPAARVTALDSSAEMVAAARERGIDAEQADVVDWAPEPDTDVVITNAVLQWVPTHLRLLPRWLAALPAGRLVRAAGAGQLRRAVARRWSASCSTSPAGAARSDLRGDDAVPEPAGYAELLAGRRRPRSTSGRPPTCTG